MQAVLIVIHLFLALSIIGLVLIQHGKGADAGAAFGSGASATIFGARGSTSFLSHSTAIMAALFFTSSLALAYFSSQVTESQGIMKQLPTDKEKTVPASDKNENLSVPAATVDTKLNQETKTVAMGSEPVPGKEKEKLATPKIAPTVEAVKPVEPPPVVVTPVPAAVPVPTVPKVEVVKPVAPATDAAVK